MQNNHNILKIFMPLLACIYGLSLSFLCGSFIGEEFKLEQYLLSNILEIALIAVTFLIIHELITKLFPQVRNYVFHFPRIHVAVFIFMVIPLWTHVQYSIIHMVYANLGNVDMQPFTYTSQELKEDLIASISAVLLAPVYEELCFRFLALAPFRKKRSQIIFGILTAAFFSVLHIRNMLAVFMDSLIYTMVFIFTRNVVVNIWIHMCSNLYVTALAVITYYGLWDIRYNASPVILLAENRSAWITVVIMAVVGVLILVFGELRQTRNRKESISKI